MPRPPLTEGFTLLELLTTLSVVGIIGFALIGPTRANQNKKEDARFLNEVRAVIGTQRQLAIASGQPTRILLTPSSAELQSMPSQTWTRDRLISNPRNVITITPGKATELQFNSRGEMTALSGNNVTSDTTYNVINKRTLEITALGAGRFK